MLASVRNTCFSTSAWLTSRITLRELSAYPFSTVTSVNSTQGGSYAYCNESRTASLLGQGQAGGFFQVAIERKSLKGNPAAADTKAQRAVPSANGGTAKVPAAHRRPVCSSTTYAASSFGFDFRAHNWTEHLSNVHQQY